MKRKKLKLNSKSPPTNTMVSNPHWSFSKRFLPHLELKKSLVLLEKAGKEKDFKMSASLTKQFKKLRKNYTLADTVLVIKFYLPDLY